MRNRTASRLIQTIGTYTRERLGLPHWLREKRDRRAVAKRERELEQEIRQNGLNTLLEPHWEEFPLPGRKAS